MYGSGRWRDVLAAALALVAVLLVASVARGARAGTECAQEGFTEGLTASIASGWLRLLSVLGTPCLRTTRTVMDIAAIAELLGGAATTTVLISHCIHLADSGCALDDCRVVYIITCNLFLHNYSFKLKDYISSALMFYVISFFKWCHKNASSTISEINRNSLRIKQDTKLKMHSS